MSDRAKTIYKLQNSDISRKAYIKAKVGAIVPAQIRALRLKLGMARQKDLAVAAGIHQSRVSMFETPGANLTIDTLAHLAAVLRVGLVVKFVPFSEMLRWENEFSQDTFDITRIDEDREFANPSEHAGPISQRQEAALVYSHYIGPPFTVEATAVPVDPTVVEKFLQPVGKSLVVRYNIQPGVTLVQTAGEVIQPPTWRKSLIDEFAADWPVTRLTNQDEAAVRETQDDSQIKTQR